MERHLACMGVALALLTSILPAGSATVEPTIDLTRFAVGDVVLEGTLTDGGCVYPSVDFVLGDDAGRRTLHSTEECRILLAPEGILFSDPQCSDDQCMCEGGCTSTQGSGCAECVPVPIDVGDCATVVCETPCSVEVCKVETVGEVTLAQRVAQGCGEKKTLHSRITSGYPTGPTTVRRSITFQEGCPGLNVVAWSGSCAGSGTDWKTSSCDLNVDNYVGFDEAQRGVRGDFHHHHWWGNHGSHFMKTWVRAHDAKLDECYYHWTWNDHTNIVTVDCWSV